MHMVKVISLSEPAYRILKSLKKKDQSFSDVVVERLGHQEAKKTETIQDLINWVERQPKRKGKKTHLSTRMDEYLYGPNRWGK